MNPWLDRLLFLLNERRGQETTIARDDLIHALHLISAPHSLEGLVKVCVHLTQLVEQFSGIRNQSIEKLDERLGLLREIGRLGSRDQRAAGPVDGHFLDSHLPHSSPTPLHPYTGDGPICDVLMLRIGEPDESDSGANAASAADQTQYDALIAWFVWSAMRFHREFLLLETYKAYVTSASGEPRLNLSKNGQRIAAMGREFRRLADPARYKERQTLTDLGVELTEARARHLARLAAHVHRVPRITPDVIARWARVSESDDDGAARQVVAMRDNVAPAVRFILRILWVRGTSGRGETSPAQRQHTARHKLTKPRVLRYGHTRGQVHAAYSGDEETGLIIGIDRPEPAGNTKRPSKREQAEAVVDPAEDPDEPGADSILQLYIGHRLDDHVGHYYAAKSAQYHAEYRNAQLSIDKDRLSAAGIKALLKALAYRSKDNPDTRGGKLLVLLTLMTGHSRDDVKKTLIERSDAAPDPKTPIRVMFDERVLVVKAATPELKPGDQARSVRAKMGTHLRIKLPGIATDLLGDGGWLAKKPLYNNSVEHAATSLLRSLPTHYGITLTAIRAALGQELLAAHAGDLGIVKLITDAGGLNYANIIHYASYSQSMANDAWADAISALLGEPVASVPLDHDDTHTQTRLGTPDAIDKEALRRHLQRLSGRLNQSLAGDEPIRAYNLFTLYTLLWLNLATASRSRVHPAPVAIIDNIAVVSDKHRQDDSAERIVPLTDGVLQQLRHYAAFVWHLAFRNPRLQPIADAFESGVLDFRFLDESGHVVSFRPKWLYEHDRLIPMPGNWARKLVRAEMTGIGGRFLDAGIGHWVAGRHPYRVTSTLASRRAREAWLAGQQDLEKALGFKVIPHPGLRDSKFTWPVVGALKPPSVRPKEVAASPGKTIEIDFEAECVAADKALYRAIDDSVPQDRDAAAAAQLVVKVFARHRDTGHAYEVARACCAEVRHCWKLPLFAERPRRQFQRDWLIDRVALHNLGFFSANVLPSFEKELAHLPAPADPSCADALDLGRFFMLCIWRQGLVTWPVLDAFLQNYCDNGILGTGSLRYVPTAIRCRRNGAPMERLNYLAPYCQVYMVCEYARLKAALAPLCELNTQQRRAKIQASLLTYLKQFTDVTVGNILTVTMGAARQYHMLHGSPVLAAYASAEFETHDLPDQEIRRLAGLAPREQAASGAASTAPSVEAELADESSELPGQAIDPQHNVVHRIASKKSPRTSEIDRQIDAMKIEAPVERLLAAFAKWLLRREIKTINDRIAPPEKKRYKQIVEVVGYSLVGFTLPHASSPTIDETLLSNIEVEFRDMHPDIDPGPPFAIFRRFLRQASGRAAVESIGLTIGDIEPGTSRTVLAKIVTPEDVREVRAAIDSVLSSGIGNPDVRRAAKRHLDYVSAYGLRRTEAEKLRMLDIQGDFIKVQPYGEHSLKTDWSNRLLPAALGASEASGASHGFEGQTVDRAITHGLANDVNGHSFFDQVNKLLQQRTGDSDMHLHIVRHAVASRLFLSMLSEAVDISRIESAFGWLRDFQMPADKVDALLGHEGHGGHGLQAVSALLGHSHPLTTLRYYIHTVGVAFYAHLCGLPNIDPIRAFESRLGSPRTMQRRARKWRAQTADKSAQDAHDEIIEQLRSYAEAANPAVVAIENQPRYKPGTGDDDAGQQAAAASDPDAINFERIEQLERICRGDAPNDKALPVDEIKAAMRRIAAIPSGKRGSPTSRHPMYIEADGAGDCITLPKRLPAASPTQSAAMCCDWLESLRRKQPDDFVWLMEKWLFASEREFGRMRLDETEATRWSALPASACVQPVVESKQHSSGQAKRSSRTVKYARIRCVDDRGSYIRRDASAIRWTMTWVCAMYFDCPSGE